MTGDGALDAIRIRNHPVAGPTLEITGSWADFGMCGFSRFQLVGAPLNQRVLMGNISFGGRPDLVFLNLAGSQAAMLVYQANGFYQETRTFQTGASADANATYLLADYNSDGRGDLYKVSGSTLEIWDAASNFATRLLQAALPSGSGQVLMADRDLDGLPDLYRLGAQRIAAGHHWGFWVHRSQRNPGGILGRRQQVTSLDSRTTTATATPISTVLMARGTSPWRWATNRSTATSTAGSAPLISNARTRLPTTSPDVSPTMTRTHWWPTSNGRQGVGITVGCNAPFNDLYLPAEPGHPRADGDLPRAITEPSVWRARTSSSMTAGNSHEDSINRIAAAGITTGCSAGDLLPRTDGDEGADGVLPRPCLRPCAFGQQPVQRCRRHPWTGHRRLVRQRNHHRVHGTLPCHTARVARSSATRWLLSCIARLRSTQGIRATPDLQGPLGSRSFSS